MRALAVCAVIALMAACAYPTGGRSVWSQYDDIRGQTVVEGHVLFSSPSEPFAVRLLHTFDGREITERPDHAVLVLVAGASVRGWQHLEDQRLFLLIDGEERSELHGEHDGQVGRGHVRESVAFRVPIETLERIAVAGSVQGRMGDRSFALGERARENVAAFLDRVTPQ